MNRSLKILMVILVLLIAIGGAIYYYSLVTQDKNLLKITIESLANQGSTEYSRFKSTSNSTLEIEMPLLTGTEVTTSESPEEEIIEIDKKNNKVTITNEEGTEELTLKEYNKENNPIQTQELWKEAIDNGDFEKDEETEYNGEKAKKYTLKSDKVSEELKKFLNDSMEENFGETQVAEGLFLDNFEMIFDGDLLVDVYFNKKNELLAANIYTNDVITLNFEFTGETVELLLGAYETILGIPNWEKLDENTLTEEELQYVNILNSLDGELPDTKGKFILKNLEVTYEWEEIKLEGDKKVPTNPLLLLLANSM